MCIDTTISILLIDYFCVSIQTQPIRINTKYRYFPTYPPSLLTSAYKSRVITSSIFCRQTQIKVSGSFESDYSDMFRFFDYFHTLRDQNDFVLQVIELVLKSVIMSWKKIHGSIYKSGVDLDVASALQRIKNRAVQYDGKFSVFTKNLFVGPANEFVIAFCLKKTFCKEN